MGSKIEKCTGKILGFYDPETGWLSNDKLPRDNYDFYMPKAMEILKEGQSVSYETVSEPPTGRRIVKNIVRR